MKIDRHRLSNKARRLIPIPSLKVKSDSRIRPLPHQTDKQTGGEIWKGRGRMSIKVSSRKGNIHCLSISFLLLLSHRLRRDRRCGCKVSDETALHFRQERLFLFFFSFRKKLKSLPPLFPSRHQRKVISAFPFPFPDRQRTEGDPVKDRARSRASERERESSKLEKKQEGARIVERSEEPPGEARGREKGKESNRTTREEGRRQGREEREGDGKILGDFFLSHQSSLVSSLLFLHPTTHTYTSRRTTYYQDAFLSFFQADHSTCPSIDQSTQTSHAVTPVHLFPSHTYTKRERYRKEASESSHRQRDRLCRELSTQQNEEVSHSVPCWERLLVHHLLHSVHNVGRHQTSLSVLFVLRSRLDPFIGEVHRPNLESPIEEFLLCHEGQHMAAESSYRSLLNRYHALVLCMELPDELRVQWLHEPSVCNRHPEIRVLSLQFLCRIHSDSQPCANRQDGHFSFCSLPGLFDDSPLSNRNSNTFSGHLTQLVSKLAVEELHAVTVSSRVTDSRWTVIDFISGLQHVHQFDLIGRCHDDKVRNGGKVREVKAAVVGRSVGTHETGAVENQPDRQFLESDVMHDLVVSSLKEGGVHSNERLHALSRQTRTERHCVLFCNPDVECPLREPLPESPHSCPSRHRGSDCDHASVLLRDFDQGVGKHGGVGG
mmetsp:Transcript_29741/g.58382  ORF Transcript_29741/g.58382 Transcript_29741/m.58382 type:complete len:661 (+) Transcript_29741:20-2002(+)